MTLRILVVGAGIGGLAAARGLRVAGFRPEVVEEQPAGAVPEGGIFLPGNATRALRRLGLDRPLGPLGQLIFRQVYQDAGGRALFELDTAALWAGAGESRALLRADLQRVMLTGVGGEVRYDTAVRDLEILDDGAAKVEFADGRVAGYDLVVAADGRTSRIRERAGLSGEIVPTGRMDYSGVVSGGPPLADWTSLLGEDSHFVAIPMGGRRIFYYGESVSEEVPADPRARLVEIFEGFGGCVPAILSAAGEVYAAPIDEVVAERYSRGPVLLVGDAAHATAPTLAQGVAMALEDGVVLGEVLKRSGADVAAALAAYEKRRRSRCDLVRERTRENDLTRHAAPGERDPMLRKGGRRIFMDQYRELVEPF